MDMFQAVSAASDRVIATLIAGLEIEFGRGAGEGLAQHFLSAENVDYRWAARASERWLGSYEGADDDDLSLDRVAICGRLDGKWFAATMIVDGDGEAHGMLGCRTFRSERGAREAMIWRVDRWSIRPGARCGQHRVPAFFLRRLAGVWEGRREGGRAEVREKGKAR